MSQRLNPLKTPSRETRKPPLSTSVVCSFYNEEDNILEMVSRLRDVFAGLATEGIVSSYEILFIDDNSTDRSNEILRTLIAAARFEGEIKLLKMSRNFGVSACVQAGLSASSGDIVIYMDCDLQDPPEVIPRLVEGYLADPLVEVVHTVRKSRIGESRIKLAITAIGYRLLRSVSTVDLELEAGDFKLLSRRVVDELGRLQEINPYMRGLVAWVGFKQTTVYYERQARFGGQTKFPVLSPGVIRNFFTSALIGFSDIPLIASSIAGLAISFFAFVGGMGFLAAIFFGIPIRDTLWLAVGISFLSGIHLLALGMLGLYIAAIHKESRRRPLYIVEYREGFSV